MDIAPKTYLRMRDAAIALYAANKFNQPLNRLRLQKFIYLMDVLSCVYEIYSARDGHKTYFNGPYDSSIQNAVDVLIFRGFAQARSIIKVKDGRIYAQYSITKSGIAWVDSSAKAPWFASKLKIADRIALNVNRVGWEKIKALVYAEPTYISSRKNGFGAALNSTDSLAPSAAKVFELIRSALEVGSEAATRQIPPDLIADIFFRYLATYDSNRKLTVAAGARDDD